MIFVRKLLPEFHIRGIIITKEDRGATKEEPDLYLGKRIDVMLKPVKKSN